MELVELVGSVSPLAFSGKDVSATLHATPETPFSGETIVNYYTGITGIANYIYDVTLRVFQLFICCCTKPWPRWSWKAKEMVTEEVITLRDESKKQLKMNEFFVHLIRNATMPLNVKTDKTATSLWQDLVQTDNTATYGIIIRRRYFNNFLCGVSIHTATGQKHSDLVCSFRRSNKEIQEHQRGVYISKHIHKENSLWISKDRVAYKRDVIRKGMNLAGISLVSQSSGHPDEHMLTFLENTIFQAPKNGCTSAYFNPKSREFELRCIIRKDDYEKMEDKVEAFNKKQTRPKGEKAQGCRAELTPLTSDDAKICDVILAIKRIDLSQAR